MLKVSEKETIIIKHSIWFCKKERAEFLYGMKFPHEYRFEKYIKETVKKNKAMEISNDVQITEWYFVKYVRKENNMSTW